MRTYENIIIVHPDKVGDEYNAIVEKFKGVLADLNANLLKVDEWGVRKLAYPVKKRHYGHYVLMEFASDPALVMELERNMRLDERVLKFITVKVDEKWDPEKEASAPKSAPVLSDEEEEASREESEEGEAYEGEEEEEEEEE